jgi:tol-pal system protein YbgF
MNSSYVTDGSQTGMKAGGLRLLIRLVLSVMVIAGCASADDIGKLQYDVVTLKSEVKDLKKSRMDRKLEDSLRAMEVEQKALQEEQKNTGKAVSDLFIKNQSLTGEFQVLTGRFEEARYISEDYSRKMDVLTIQIQELKSGIAELDKKIASLYSVKTPVEKKAPGGETEEGGDAGDREKKDSEEGQKKEIKDIYMEAYRTLRDEKFSEAREKFEALLRDFTENEYSDNARFWIGESYYREKNYEDAILAYEDVLKKHPESEKAPAAMLKQGMAFYELQDPETGRIILEKLIEKFPDSEQTGIARKKLRPPTPEKKR